MRVQDADIRFRLQGARSSVPTIKWLRSKEPKLTLKAAVDRILVATGASTVTEAMAEMNPPAFKPGDRVEVYGESATVITWEEYDAPGNHNRVRVSENNRDLYTPYRYVTLSAGIAYDSTSYLKSGPFDDVDRDAAEPGRPVPPAPAKHALVIVVSHCSLTALSLLSHRYV